MGVVIRAENISKQYKLGAVGISSLTDDVQRLMARLRGKEDPFLKVGEENAREKTASQNDSKYVWALKDVNFEIEQGEVVGIIGKNGAGKSTLLKILSRVTEPTIGSLKYKGRLASLLEVGTGFHPDLSGRDNVFLNGAILGMKRHEIARKFDEIVEFSGVARYIDTPVKRYSSGMYVRLAFAVAAHLEPDILVIDEVLAVGDQEFQDKCLGKMKDVAGQGRTVLFVSHNILAVKAICKRGILMRHGALVSDGKIDDVISDYVRTEEFNAGEELDPEKALINTGEGHIKKIYLVTEKQSGHDLFYRERIRIELEFELYTGIEDFISDVRILSKEGAIVGYAMPKFDMVEQQNLPAGKYTQIIEIDNNLQPDVYFLSLGIHYGRGATIHYFEKVMQIRILSVGINHIDYPVSWYEGNFRPAAKWSIEQRK
ncbi:MAG: ABC transporter ATP-binding protein [Bacteroidia bacterium]|nr:ABC transporter ATP-binding protein [Bacteroidia bacterium]